MSPRPYALGKRQMAVQETRARIVASVAELVASGDDPLGFTIDAVARGADVARMTVYHQFESKRGLFEALCDDLAEKAELGPRLGAAFQRADPLEALDAFVAAFGHFWNVNRAAIRRLDAIATLNSEIGRGNYDRNDRRRDGLRRLLERLAVEYGRPRPDAFDDMLGVFQTLTSFATFDGLAGATRTPEDVIPTVRRLLRLAAELPMAGTGETA